MKQLQLALWAAALCCTGAMLWFPPYTAGRDIFYGAASFLLGCVTVLRCQTST